MAVEMTNSLAPYEGETELALPSDEPVNSHVTTLICCSVSWPP